MNDTATLLLIGASLVLAAWSLVLVILGRTLNDPLFYGLAVLEAALLAQLVAGSVALAGTDRDVDGVTFIGYLVTAVLIPPLAVIWSVADKSRWGTTVLVVGCLTVAILVVRMDQIWTLGA
ncbi:MAG TPA: hypothetical protein VFJ14_02720 [Nocardioidaceae bacterium]|nr:hypothetical protein [Nocardioidaceae bacterium]